MVMGVARTHLERASLLGWERDRLKEAEAEGLLAKYKPGSIRVSDLFRGAALARNVRHLE